MSRQLVVTTSWDDGSMLDIRVSELLEKYGIKGTFYIPNDFGKTTGKFKAYKRRLNEHEIRQISQYHEIGGHTISHRSLKGLEEQDIINEMVGNKHYLENIIGKPVTSFAYPNGMYDKQISSMALKAGFNLARTTVKLSFEVPKDNLTMPVSIMAAPYPFRKINASNIYWRRALDPLIGYGWSLFRYPKLIASSYSWQAFARASVQEAISRGGYLHLYGHRWEIEAYNFWSQLELFFQYLSSLRGVSFVTNNEIYENTISNR